MVRTFAHSARPFYPTHTLRAFTALAPGTLTSEELAAMNEAVTSTPPSDPDPLFGRPILLRRTAGQSRVTIFDGNHEWFPEAAIEWLAQHQR